MKYLVFLFVFATCVALSPARPQEKCSCITHEQAKHVLEIAQQTIIVARQVKKCNGGR